VARKEVGHNFLAVRKLSENFRVVGKSLSESPRFVGENPHIGGI